MLTSSYAKYAASIFAITCLGSASSTQAFQRSRPVYAHDPYLTDKSGQGLHNWTHILWIGPETHPQPLIWLTHNKMKPLSFPEINVVLPVSEYRKVQRLPISRYATRPVRSIADGTMGAFRISQRNGSLKTRTYFLSSVGGCGYMADILALKGVNWPSTSRASLSEYAVICKIAKRPLPSGY